jgi:regulator of RNase E activity RraA
MTMERWRRIPTAIIADVSGGACLIDPAVRPLRPAGQQPRLFGTAVTARCAAPDFGAVLQAIDQVEPGNVFVIDAQGFSENAMIGGILGGTLARKGASGFVCDGAIRDVAELAAMEKFSVYARAITPRGPTAWERGAVNQPVTIGGRRVAAGDLIIGDDDGLVCLSPAEQGALLDKAEAKLALEDEWVRRLKAGETLASVFSLQQLKH